MLSKRGGCVGGLQPSNVVGLMHRVPAGECRVPRRVLGRRKVLSAQNWFRECGSGNGRCTHGTSIGQAFQPSRLLLLAAPQGEGLFEGLDWLSNTLKSKRR